MTASRRKTWRIVALLTVVAAVPAIVGLELVLREARIREQEAATRKAEILVKSKGGYLTVMQGRGEIAVWLSETDISDHDLETLAPRLAQVPRLVELSLYGTPITNKGIAYLRAIKGLQHLDLTNTRVTKEGVMGLARFLPRCRIGFGGSSNPEVWEPIEK